MKIFRLLFLSWARADGYAWRSSKVEHVQVGKGAMRLGGDGAALTGRRADCACDESVRIADAGIVRGQGGWGATFLGNADQP